MKSIALVSALMLATPAVAFASNYELASVPHDGIEEYMVAGSNDTNTPANLQGLWWMNGNPLADEIVSFASADFTDIVKDGEVVGHEAYIPVYDQGVWSWHDSLPGRILYSEVLRTRLVYHAVFNADYTYGDVTPISKALPILPRLEIMQSLLLKFSMKQVSPDEFSRDSLILGRPFSYRFRRVVDGEGNRTAAYADFLAKMGGKPRPDNALLPLCKTDLSGVLPTACADKRR